jgi:nitrogen regulatory protein PII
MEAVVRIEVVTSSAELQRLCTRLGDAGIVSYTIVPGVRGQGERGRQDGDDPAGVSGNSYLLTTCTRDQLPRVVEAIRAVLRESGGECLVSDAARIRH